MSVPVCDRVVNISTIRMEEDNETTLLLSNPEDGPPQQKSAPPGCSVTRFGGYLTLTLLLGSALLLSGVKVHQTWNKQKLHPVIIIPGTGGSQMDVRLNKNYAVSAFCKKQTQDWENLWINIPMLLPFLIKCLADNMRLVYDPVSNRTVSPPGVEIRIPGFGKTHTVEWLDRKKRAGKYFSDVVDMLVSIGYERGVTVKGAPYDFRKAGNEQEKYFESLNDMIQQAYYDNSQQKVILVSHSLGSKMISYFLSKQTLKWKSKYIDSIVNISPAIGGSVRALVQYVTGDDLGSWIVSSMALRSADITFPSVAWMMPPYQVFKNHVVIQTPSKNLTALDYQEFWRAANVSHIWDMYQSVKDLDVDYPAPQVEVHTIYGYNVSTVEKLVYTKEEDYPFKPTFLEGDGDGTVNLRSLELYKRWYNQQKQKIYVQRFSGADHTKIVNNPKLVDYLKRLVNDKNAD